MPYELYSTLEDKEGSKEEPELGDDATRCLSPPLLLASSHTGAPAGCFPSTPKPAPSHHQLPHKGLGHGTFTSAISELWVTFTLHLPTSAFTAQPFKDFQYHNEALGLDAAGSRETA